MRHIFALLGILLFLNSCGEGKKYATKTFTDYESGWKKEIIENDLDRIKYDDELKVVYGEPNLIEAIKVQRKSIREHNLDPLSEVPLGNVMRYKGKDDQEWPEFKQRLIYKTWDEKGNLMEIKVMNLASGREIVWYGDGRANYYEGMWMPYDYVKMLMEEWDKHPVGSEFWCRYAIIKGQEDKMLPIPYKYDKTFDQYPQPK